MKPIEMRHLVGALAVVLLLLPQGMTGAPPAKDPPKKAPAAAAKPKAPKAKPAKAKPAKAKPAKAKPAKKLLTVKSVKPKARKVVGPKPRWHTIKRPVAPVRPVLYPWPKQVPIAGRTIVVQQPDQLVVQAPQPEGTAQTSSAEESPLVEFARLADQRMRELHAYEKQGQMSDAGTTQGAEGRIYKAYYRFPFRETQVKVLSMNPMELEGEVTYDQVLFVQSADSMKELTAQVGQPSKGTPPAPTSEKYLYRNGEWSYIEPK